MVQGPGVQKTFRLSSHTPEQFNVMPRTMLKQFQNYASIFKPLQYEKILVQLFKYFYDAKRKMQFLTHREIDPLVKV